LPFNASDAFALSDGLPMALLSAWAGGLTVVMTPECNVPDGFAAGAAIRVNANPESIADGLNTLGAMSDRERSTMGARGRRLVEEKFTWRKAAVQMREVYNWVLGRAGKTHFVFEE
jgi:glycosyltransferase involved in cell wall biosynthesis